MDVTKATSLLSLANPNHFGSFQDTESADGQAKAKLFHNVSAAHTEVGTPFSIQKANVESLAVARNRLLSVMETTLQEAGHPPSLLHAQNLGQAGAHLQGEVSSENLRAMLDNKSKDTRWAFTQNSDGSINPIESKTKFHALSDGRQVLTLTRQEIANKIANEVDSKVGMDLITKVIDNTKANIKNAIETAGWAAKNSFLADNAKHYVNEAIEAGKLVTKATEKLIPKQLGIIVPLITGAVAGIEDASASTGDGLTKTSVFLNRATADIGGTGARELANGNVDKGLRDIASIYVNGSESILRSPEALAVINALPKDSATLTQMQSDIKLPPIDRHLAEYQLQVIESSAKGDLLKGLSASSTLTDLAEKKVLLKVQWVADADTFKAATGNPNTDWAQFKKDHQDLAIQADLHVAAKNSGHAQAFVTQMDQLIASNTASGTPMQPIAQQLSQVTQVQHAANEANVENVASR